MRYAKCFSDKHYEIGKIDNKLYSSFTEHLGRSIYSGIYEPGHPTADEKGYRMDVAELVKELGVPVIRYPGGNFVSCYDWHDGIGPKEQRPRRMDYAWATIETNEFGIDEFCQWAEKVGIEPMIAVNLGTGSIKDAGDLVEYCNHPGGTYWSDLRAQNGHPEPYNIKYWCLGNEMEGSWQAGHLSAEDYTKKALEAAKIMRWVDPSIKLVACGSSYEMLPTYLEWDRVMLTELYEQVDYISTHNYTMNAGQGTTNFLAAYKQLDTHIKASAKAVEFVKAKNHFDKDIKICLDEWNVWNFQDIKLDSLDDLAGLTTFEMTSAEKWEVAPSILQEKYSLLDALVVGGLGITLLNNVDTVEIACLAQLINVIAPITTIRNGGIFKQTIYHPFHMLSKYGHGVTMKAVVDAETYNCEFGDLPIVEPAVVYNEETDEVRVFVLNCSQDEDTEFEMELQGYGDKKVKKHLVLNGDDLEARNTFEDPDRVVMKELEVPADSTKVVLPKMSWNIVIYG
ncbi:Alpha-N-arabinofuranosidase [uncultured Clostridium sp.]|uniref:non-reducing end alpha-L-arabinofuranosidase n=1 Tax=Muricoprocola aceti TaxID=2981772 RepID=A0ABT2SNU5_9FIRM|nr:alpha-N-arabinofuranosidase [Muricoprocola aceti]MCI7227584.1 alpha-N-arabinofuranosidase [Lachnospiraceae bacterium]MCU6726191.1 alpha-N-arabinofuranosidase [Muricoprocola aceti]MDD7436167.1 alpha-N-arabinofuranosidase [Lachnospiraceae bacterium]SCH81036.1 Alpha-N-arabinofuranosidase [uncultured Clostridium sp.]